MQITPPPYLITPVLNKYWLELVTIAVVDGHPHPPLLDNGQQTQVKSLSILCILRESCFQHALNTRVLHVGVRQPLPPVRDDEIFFFITSGHNL